MLDAGLPPKRTGPSVRAKPAPLLHKSIPLRAESRPQLAARSAGEPRLNRLLAALPEDERSRLLPHFESMEMPAGMVLTESGAAPAFVYFPTTAIVSVQYITADGSSAEVAVIGNEGIVGAALFMGGGSALSRAVVRGVGRGCRLRAAVLLALFDRSVLTRHLLLRYTQALITQVAQTAVCNRHHSIDQQLCRWLLLSLDRSQGRDLQVTQELIAEMLGVRREGVTEAAGHLQKDGLIRYARGRIAILDRAGLEHRVCECYAAVTREYSRLLREPPGPADR